MDGCFDVCHFGHYNVIRQSNELGVEVVVGVHSNQEIEKNKGPPVLNLEERAFLVSACKWTAKVVPNAPFTSEISYLDEYGCQVAIHGDDLVLNADGYDCYKALKESNRFDTVPRTKSISTTNLIQRMLNLPPDQFPPDFNFDLLKNKKDSPNLKTFLPTTHFISQFAYGLQAGKDSKIVYVSGNFDLLHPGHVSFLQKAKALGDYLLVGVHSDQDVVGSGKRVPIMSVYERVMNLLAIRFVDDVIIGAPLEISKSFLRRVNASLVVEGSSVSLRPDDYKIPKELGIYQKIESDFPHLSARSIIQRILVNYHDFAKRNAAKLPNEIALQ